MSLLTEQEIRDIARSVKEIGENSDRALILASQKAVIEKIKAQGFVGVFDHYSAHDAYIQIKLAYADDSSVCLYRLPEGD